MSKKKQTQRQRAVPRRAVGSTEGKARGQQVLDYRVEEGLATLTLSAPLPAPTMTENKRWPWGRWQVNYVEGQLKKDAMRVLQTLSNLRFVKATVEAREADKASRSVAQPQQQASAEAAGPPDVN